jgi:hypothetical protein
MADVKSSIDLWSSTSGNNLPSDSTTIGGGLADNLQELQGVVVRAFRHKGSDLVSAATVDLGATEGLYHDVTGSVTISSFGTTAASGQWKLLQFDAALTLTYNATSMILPGNADITTAAGDMCCVIHEGSGNWRMLWYTDDSVTPTSLATAATDVGTATSSNTASTIVKRDGSGNFSAGTITATLSGNATNVTGTVAIANGGTDGTTAASGFNNLAAGIVAAKGDLIAASSGSATGNLTVGSNNTVLMADSAQSYGVKWATITEGTALAASSVDQTALKTALSTELTWSADGLQTLAGGYYAFCPNTKYSTTGATWVNYNGPGSSNSTSYALYQYADEQGGAATFYMQGRYVNSSPPYSLGNGDIPFFIFVAVASSGELVMTNVAEDPPWAHNGPNSITPDYYENGKGYRNIPNVKVDKAKLADPAQRQQHLNDLRNGGTTATEVTREFKNTDMPLFPHPFAGYGPNPPSPLPTPVIVDPVGQIAEDLKEIHRQGESVADILRDYMTLQNTPIPGVNAPPGVMAVKATWKNNP